MRDKMAPNFDMSTDNCILMTGFGPFRDHAKNISWSAVKVISENQPDFLPHVHAYEMEVAYDTVQKRVPELWKEHRPRLTIHVGLDAGSNGLKIERCAHNGEYKGQDVRACCLEKGVVNANRSKDLCLRTGLDVEKAAEEAKQLWRQRFGDRSDLKVGVSDNAGLYLCEYIYYTSLQQDSTRTVFIHVPPKPAYGKRELADALAVIAEALLQQL